jgi:glycosyltransferase involved in cell wall biosynthesis
VRPFIADEDCIVLPSYREGLPRVLLEAGAMATLVVATDVPGCRQAVEHGVTGLLCEPRSAAALAQAMIAIAVIPLEDRMVMGQRGRAKAEREFSEERVVAADLEALEEIDG